MSNHKSRLVKLEARHEPEKKIVVRYKDQTAPDELAALAADKNIILLVVEYKDRQNNQE